MFKPCPNCGFLVALIAGREASQRCPRCGSAMLEDGEAIPAGTPDAPATPARVPTPRHRHEPVHTEPAEARGTHPPSGRAATDPPDATAPADADGGRAANREATPAAGATDAADPATRDAFGPGDIADTDGTDGTPAPPVAESAEPEPAPPAAAPSFMARRERARARRAGRRWPWAVALPLLALLLGLQLLLSQRVELAQHAAWRPWVAATCGALGCDVPAWREPAAFAMLARNVRPHASRAGVLHVTTSLRNDARWPQPLPVVVLSLSDVDGRVLAARAVAPSDYARGTQRLVAPGDSVDIAFDVREPSPRVVSFDFQLR